MIHQIIWFRKKIKRTSLSRCLSVLDFWNVNLGVYYKLEKNGFRIKLDFFFEFELDFYCLCSLQKSISKSNWFLNFLNLIFQNWKKIEWYSIFQKSSGDRQGVCLIRGQAERFQKMVNGTKSQFLYVLTRKLFVMNITSAITSRLHTIKWTYLNT